MAIHKQFALQSPIGLIFFSCVMGINVTSEREEHHQLNLFHVLFNNHEIHQITSFSVYRLTYSSLAQLEVAFCPLKGMPHTSNRCMGEEKQSVVGLSCMERADLYLERQGIVCGKILNSLLFVKMVIRQQIQLTTPVQWALC